MIKEFSLICGGIAALLLVLGLAGNRDMKACAEADRRASRLAMQYALQDGGREYFEMQRRILQAKYREVQRRREALK